MDISATVAGNVSVGVRRHQAGSPGTPAVQWSYADLDRRQREIAGEVLEGRSGALLLSEVAPVITVGRRTGPGDILLSPELLKLQGIELHNTDRGGLATWHGPGQWVLFAVASLENLTGDPRGVRLAVEGLLEVALQVGRHYEPKAEIRGGNEQGVWGPHGKFAAVGVHIEQGVLLHGLSVNGFRTPSSFMGLRPCGLDLPVGYLLPEPSESAFTGLGISLKRAALSQFWRK